MNRNLFQPPNRRTHNARTAAAAAAAAAEDEEKRQQIEREVDDMEIPEQEPAMDEVTQDTDSVPRPQPMDVETEDVNMAGFEAQLPELASMPSPTSMSPSIDDEASDFGVLRGEEEDAPEQFAEAQQVQQVVAGQQEAAGQQVQQVAEGQQVATGQQDAEEQQTMSITRTLSFSHRSMRRGAGQVLRTKVFYENLTQTLKSPRSRVVVLGVNPSAVIQKLQRLDTLQMKAARSPSQLTRNEFGLQYRMWLDDITKPITDVDLTSKMAKLGGRAEYYANFAQWTVRAHAAAICTTSPVTRSTRVTRSMGRGSASATGRRNQGVDNDNDIASQISTAPSISARNACNAHNVQSAQSDAFSQHPNPIPLPSSQSNHNNNNLNQQIQSIPQAQVNANAPAPGLQRIRPDAARPGRGRRFDRRSARSPTAPPAQNEENRNRSRSRRQPGRAAIRT